MADASTKKRRRGWRQPAWRDPAFWVAVTIAVVAVLIQASFIADRSNWFSWAGLALQAAITWILISAIIRIRVGMRRGLVEGARDADAAARARTAGVSTSETIARTGGRTVGRALNAYKRSKSLKDR